MKEVNEKNEDLEGKVNNLKEQLYKTQKEKDHMQI